MGDFKNVVSTHSHLWIRYKKLNTQMAVGVSFYWQIQASGKRRSHRRMPKVSGLYILLFKV